MSKIFADLKKFSLTGAISTFYLSLYVHILAAVNGFAIFEFRKCACW
jgi:hypothetical protein